MLRRNQEVLVQGNTNVFLGKIAKVHLFTCSVLHRVSHTYYDNFIGEERTDKYEQIKRYPKWRIYEIQDSPEP